ncbi:hypothetical protein BDY19DRAFT_965084 [Irpex rosettiformis]|uniref:Uncharacterized protein n=1 Tax=Irpex rosettiformis TaxID=378272 RepID=A0ACB8TUG8_9APHY|nr:hypothetical protein BDY19DRAFT_965084 [Irpex rosettiformis]
MDANKNREFGTMMLRSACTAERKQHGRDRQIRDASISGKDHLPYHNHHHHREVCTPLLSVLC